MEASNRRKYNFNITNHIVTDAIAWLSSCFIITARVLMLWIRLDIRIKTSYEEPTGSTHQMWSARGFKKGMVCLQGISKITALLILNMTQKARYRLNTCQYNPLLLSRKNLGVSMLYSLMFGF